MKKQQKTTTTKKRNEVKDLTRICNTFFFFNKIGFHNFRFNILKRKVFIFFKRQSAFEISVYMCEKIENEF